jgi:uncharacterized protein with HEPN domain
MSKRDTQLLLEDILEAANKILAYTEGLNFNAFMEDSKTIDAVVRNFSIIGEAASRIPNEYKFEHPEIEWRRIVGFRNRIIHDYFGIDYYILWEIIVAYVPELVKKVKRLLQ